MGKKTFGIKVGVNKFIEAQSQTEQDQLEAVHKAMRMAYVAEHAGIKIANATAKQEQHGEYDIMAMRIAGRDFDAQIDENIGAFKNNIHENLQKITEKENGLDELDTYIEYMEQKYDPDIVASKQQEAEVEMVYQTQQQEDEYDYAMAR